MVEQKPMLVHYLRDTYRQPFGCIVMIDKENVGVSVCNTKDRFVKKFARDIAAGRALVKKDYLSSVPTNRFVYGYYGYDDDRTYFQEKISVRQYVEEAVEYVKKRAEKYFKD